MPEPSAFQGLRLLGGFTIIRLDLSAHPMVDAVGRRAVAQTRIIGREFFITIDAGLDDVERSVTLYHEVLEAMTVACVNPPAAVLEFNEGHFESAAYDAHERFGPANPSSLNRMLQFFGFAEE